MGYFFIAFILSMVFFNDCISQEYQLKCGVNQELGNSQSMISQVGSPRGLIIYIQFKDDLDIVPDWPTFQLPSYFNDMASSLNDANINKGITGYFRQMTNGSLDIRADVFPQLYLTKKNERDYTSYGYAGTIYNDLVQNEIIPYLRDSLTIDWEMYDNVGRFTPSPDGSIDFIFFVFRDFNNATFSGEAGFNLSNSSTIPLSENKFIQPGWGASFNPSLIMAQTSKMSQLGLQYVMAHEYGHFLEGVWHYTGAADLALVNNGIVWDASRGMHSVERRLNTNWLPQNATKDVTLQSMNQLDYATVALKDYSTTGENCVVTVDESGAKLIIENHQKISPYDFAPASGLFFYFNQLMTISNIPAKGGFNFIADQFNKKIIRGQENRFGENELNFTKYGMICHDQDGWYPIHKAAWGTPENAFTTARKTFSPWTNPSSKVYFANDIFVEIISEVNGVYTLKIGNHNPENFVSPARPINFKGLTFGRPNELGTSTVRPKLQWERNIDNFIVSGSQIQVKYQLWKKYDSEPWFLLADNLVDTSYIDQSESLYFGWDMGPSRMVFYKLRSVIDLSGVKRYSSETNPVGYEVYGGELPSKPLSAEVEDVLTNYITAFPNPFNPSTSITYSIASEGKVELKVYSMLGEEVATLVNEVKQAGSYTTDFNASSLPSGMYIYTIQSEGFSLSKKLVLIK